jgi:hypothetical protein
MTKALLITTLLFLSSFAFAQNNIADLSEDVKKGSYAILEVRLNMEDEFRTVEGRDTEGLARIALFVGSDKGTVLFKGFSGYNTVVNYLNEMKDNGWILEDTYPLEGSSLIITHFVFRKKK